MCKKEEPRELLPRAQSESAKGQVEQGESPAPLMSILNQESNLKSQDSRVTGTSMIHVIDAAVEPYILYTSTVARHSTLYSLLYLVHNMHPGTMII